MTPTTALGTTTIARTPVVSDTKQLTVSTVRISPGHYETVIFDDSPDQQHHLRLLGSYEINYTAVSASAREDAMELHREAVYVARTEEPKRAE